LSHFSVIYYYICSYIQWKTGFRTRNNRNEMAVPWSWSPTYVHC